MSAVTGKLLIGLTGGIGSGKSTVAEAFRELGADYVDADQVARQVVAPGSACLQRIVEHFGPQILNSDASLNRPLLRQLIFSDAAEKLWLEQLLHPAIREQLFQQLKQLTTPYALLVAPLLLENQLDQFTDRVLVVDISEQTQLSRTMTRDQNSAEQVKAIMASQLSRSARLARADDLLDNNGNLAQLIEQIQHLHEKYLELSQEIRHKEQYDC
ncbi:dephospho-CoA kinase [Alishewanella sp. BS5-314]|uniref:dephospho-CoA kinase n=1 Tax=Alishewanella sp. BS5-314 TaxID=2755587 RepID=UPI0021BB81C0|nr:dephospho-CoA kinase [Alishewanella sp. BS5-314]MCT8127273.1 dephospho-CoA kinase [Alishewanella sp. BS5-314]